MENEKVVKVGILGLGVVGAELVSQIINNAGLIKNQTGCSIAIEKIFVRDLYKPRSIDTTGLSLTTDPLEIIQNPHVQIVCECMGGNGADLTRNYVLEAIKNGKHVIMSSKKVLALHAAELLKSAEKAGVQLKYDASVGGGIPIAKVFEGAFKGDNVVKIMGIFNATSNYIYSKMDKGGLSFETALKKAQNKGYAENDPTDDVDGFDSLYKLTILALFGMKKIIQPSSLLKESFTKITQVDMKYAHELGYHIKPVALLKRNGGNFEYKIGPCLVPSDHILANTFSNNNIILIEGKNCGELGFYGQGAGAKPTASVMFDDLLNIIDHGFEKPKNGFSRIETDDLVPYQSKLYWRFTVSNKIGIILTISKLLAEHNINIEKFIQKEEVDDAMEIVLLTSNAGEKDVNAIIEKLKEKNIANNALIPFV